jgi:pimeloyl-ACP methyl ester carboxylesterase
MTPNAPSTRRGCLFYVRRAFKWTALTLVALILLGLGRQTLLTELDRRNFPPPGQMFDVGGYRLHIQCMGEGSPTVILEAGGMGFSTQWTWVQQDLARTHRVCAYDRAGHGWSESATTPRTPENITRDLWTLLEVANIEPPYLLVGHSYGGILLGYHAAAHLDDLVGLVFVDAADQRPIPPEQETEYAVMNRVLNGYLSILFRLSLARGIIDQEVAGYPPQAAAQIRAMESTNQNFDAYWGEFFAVPRVNAPRIAVETVGDLPVVVFAATHDLTERQMALRQEADQGYLALSTNSTYFPLENATHLTILSESTFAALIADAVRAITS